ncbi:MAG TPA: hypothetical protein VFZ56_13465 [Gemmatimonadaceae bacterium]
MTPLRALIAACALAACSLPVGAQDYRVRIDARAQAVSFRGLVADSIAAADAVVDANGGFRTPDGHAVRCSGAAFCYFFRPGPELRGVPATLSASLAMWGLGVQGLAFRASGRLVGDLGGDDVWPGTEPSLQLIEGYFDYQRSSFIARAGRQLIASRLEPMGFDGGWLRYRWDRTSLEFTGYAGWGLGQAAVVPASNPALNPLDEWRPRDRQIVAGLEAGWFYRDMDLRAEYRREIDPEDNQFVSERAAVSLLARARSIRAAAGFDYNIAEGNFGSADLTLTWLRPLYSVSAGARRYRPYFSLWTLWGAFSPVPYNAVNASAQVRPRTWLSLHARGERYRYEDAEISTALVPLLEDRGWRASAGATATLDPRWTLDANYGVERGPGASARFADGSVTFTPGERLSFDLYGGTLARPLEYRFYDAKSRWIGARAEWHVSSQRRVWGDVARVTDDRDRPDASASSLDQFRLRGGVSVAFGSGADRTPLPPARPLPR